jgi:hypothetical protein
MSAVREIAKTICHQCYAVLDVGDRFCRHCGGPLGKTTENPRPPDPAGPDPTTQPAESWKTMLTGLVLAATLLVVVLVWYVFYRSLEPLRQLHQLQGR